MYFRYVRCCQKKLGKEYAGPLCTIFVTSCESVTISGKKKKKGRQEKTVNLDKKVFLERELKANIHSQRLLLC